MATQDLIEKSKWLVDEYTAYREGNRKDKVRLDRNRGLYSAIDFGQWDAESVEILIQEQRPIITFNFIQGYVDDILGQLENNPFEARFDNINRKGVNGVNILQELWERDQELLNYNSEFRKTKLSGLIFEGFIQIYPDFSKGEIPYIGFRDVNAKHILVDPYWQSDDLNDCRMIFRYTWMTAEQIKRSFNKKIPEIEDAISKKYNTDTGLILEDRTWDNSTDFFDQKNNQYKVIEACWMDEEDTVKLYDFNTGLMQSDDEVGIETMRALSKMNGNRYKLYNEKKPVCKIFTFAPSLGYDVALENGYYPIQIGRLPYFHFTTKNLYGERQGIVDRLSDAQVTYNKRESTASHWQSVCANGSEFIEESLFIDEDEKKRYIRDKNRPSMSFTVQDGAIASQKQAPVRKGEYPQDLIFSADRAKNFMAEIANDTAAMRGQSERSGESSVLYSAKTSQGFLRLDSINQQVKKFHKEIANAWYYAAKHIYGKIPQHFMSKKTGQLISVNEFDGDQIRNSIMDLERHEVMIVESNTGLNKKKEFLGKYVELARISANPLTKTMFEKKAYDYADFTEEELEDLTKASDLFIEFQKTQMLAQTANMKAQMQQIAMQMGGGEQQIQGKGIAVEAAKSPGQGALPQGIAGSAGAETNIGSANSNMMKV